jgi:hypothetical protein
MMMMPSGGSTFGNGSMTCAAVRNAPVLEMKNPVPWSTLAKVRDLFFEPCTPASGTMAPTACMGAMFWLAHGETFGMWDHSASVHCGSSSEDTPLFIRAVDFGSDRPLLRPVHRTPPPLLVSARRRRAARGGLRGACGRDEAFRRRPRGDAPERDALAMSSNGATLARNGKLVEAPTRASRDD